MDRWAYENKVTMDYSRTGKPTDNPFIESFNGSFRGERLNAHWFLSLEEATTKIEAWQIEYNHYRSHNSLNDITPAEFVRLCLRKSFDILSLPGTSSSDEMIFAKLEYQLAASEKS